MKKSIILYKLIFIFNVFFIILLNSCGVRDGVSLASSDCYLPEGTSITPDKRYIQGDVSIPLGDGDTTEIKLYVQRVNKIGSSEWGTTAIGTLPDSKASPCDTFVEMKNLWQDFYQDMLDANINKNVIDSYVGGISNSGNTTDRLNPGVYGETDLSACGYNGFEGTIKCVAAANTGIKQYYMAHENTHAFQWDWTQGDETQNITMFRVFSSYANLIYHQNVANPGQFIDPSGRWSISNLDYALQNEAEWIAEVFPHYLYNGTGQWAYINHHYSSIANFFHCIWKEGKTFSQCQTQSSAPMVSFAEKIPVVNIPTYSGLSSAESEAVWNICFDTQNKAAHLATFNNLMSRLTPGLYTDAANYYELGYGDCNHDGILDWVCTYEGPAPDGGNYFWNTNNQVGTYTFTASGKVGDNYAEYKQDPYDSRLGTLLQPQYREWEGSFSSCNGSLSFKRVPNRFPIYSSEVIGLPAEFVGKTNW